jgi:hypothetical protein
MYLNEDGREKLKINNESTESINVECLCLKKINKTNFIVYERKNMLSKKIKEMK